MQSRLAHDYLQQLNPGKICTCENSQLTCSLATLAQFLNNCKHKYIQVNINFSRTCPHFFLFFIHQQAHTPTFFHKWGELKRRRFRPSRRPSHEIRLNFDASPIDLTNSFSSSNLVPQTCHGMWYRRCSVRFRFSSEVFKAQLRERIIFASGIFKIAIKQIFKLISAKSP